MSILDNTHIADPFLIVNVARNGGGYVTLGYRTLHVLAPYINPLYGNYTVRKSPYAEFYSSRGNFSMQDRYRLSNWMRYKNNAWYTGETEHLLYMTGHEEALSGIYTFDLAYDEVDFREDFERLVNIKTPKFLQESGNSRLVFCYRWHLWIDMRVFCEEGARGPHGSVDGNGRQPGAPKDQKPNGC